ncbi:hypothetical protein FD13_GL001038 [Levilactobacillus senmaizukei DSM 21775 = NBRC 103853]|uniref:Uncharacterized protein n=1 Tax=Levilactobacillus senmaizukei DSM 21775 = NBRC 103853 TaxID=1423803 RepID=A0A0R2DII2_9LACO|nr:hypothetical protein [Levilactobacillus senmaizukei]KRN01445.1 hypothetical protein FD13_GL001038 [Levilactobacillus senmaizukei DSM 21775 = NBRC 103853]
MSLNKELLASVQAAESKFGRVEYWPMDELKKIQATANRYPEYDGAVTREEVVQVRAYLERGFFTTQIMNKFNRSRGWVLRRTPKEFEYILTDEDRQILKYYRYKSTEEISRVLHRNAEWVRKVRKLL